MKVGGEGKRKGGIDLVISMEGGEKNRKLKGTGKKSSKDSVYNNTLNHNMEKKRGGRQGGAFFCSNGDAGTQTKGRPGGATGGQ